MGYSELGVDRGRAAYYEGLMGDASPGSADGPAVAFRYGDVSAAATDGGAPAPLLTDAVAARALDPEIGWRAPNGIQAVAQSILEHYTGEEPSQAELEALVMACGDTWAASANWTLSVDELDAIIGPR